MAQEQELEEDSDDEDSEDESSEGEYSEDYDETLEEIYEDLDDDILKQQESDFLLTQAERRMRKRLGMTIIVTGESGRGKSYFGLRYLERWYQKRFKEEFPINHVCNTPEEAVILGRNFTRKGEGILIEELSVHLGRRASMTKQNRLFNMFLDVCRLKQIIVIGNCPHISFVDKHYSMMAQSWVNVNQVDFKKDIILAKAYWLQTSPFKSDPYTHKYPNADGDDIDLCYMRKPNDQLCKAYEEIKGIANDSVLDDIVLSLQKDRQEKMVMVGHKFLSKREREAYELHLKGYTSKEGSTEMGISVRAYNKNISSSKGKLKSSEYRREMQELDKRGIKKEQKT